MTMRYWRVAWRCKRLATLCVFGGVAAVALTVSAAPSAYAQAPESESALYDEIERLRNDLIDLQKFVYAGGGNVAAAAPDVGDVTPGGDDAGAAGGNLNARMQLRIQQLEAQIRDMTGQLEQANFQMRQMALRLDRLAGDVDFRLQNLERASGVGPTSGLQGGTQVAPAQGQLAAQAGAAQPGTTVISSTGATVSASELPVAAGGELQPGQWPLAFMRQSDLESPQQADPSASPSIAPGALARSTPVTAEPAPAPTAAPAPGAVSTQAPTAGQPAVQQAAILPAGTAEEQYRFAFDLVRKQQFPEAEQALRAFVNTHAEHQLAGNAMYWLGETFYAQQRYRDSAAVFVDAYSNYLKGAKASHSLLKLGMSLGALGKTEAACTSFQELRRKFPDTEERVLRRADSESQKLGCKTG